MSPTSFVPVYFDPRSRLIPGSFDPLIFYPPCILSLEIVPGINFPAQRVLNEVLKNKSKLSLIIGLLIIYSHQDNNIFSSNSSLSDLFFNSFTSSLLQIIFVRLVSFHLKTKYLLLSVSLVNIDSLIQDIYWKISSSLFGCKNVKFMILLPIDLHKNLVQLL